MSMLIDYNLIGKAVDFYVAKGYEHINVDWMVDPKHSYATYAKEGAQFRTHDRNGYMKHLVGSAEQGFIQAAHKGEIEYGKRYVSVTPCFRRGDIGPVNQEWFMKVELNMVTENAEHWLAHREMMDDAGDCFIHLGVDRNRLKIWHDDGSTNCDIMHEYGPSPTGYLELGSYGCRLLDLTNPNLLIHYATGLALPRFQLILP